MEYFVLVQVTQPQAHLYEEAPDLNFVERTVHLLLQELAEVAIFAVLHDDANTISITKGVVVLDHVLAVDFRHDGCLKD